jgi:hypothetical protein
MAREQIIEIEIDLETGEMRSDTLNFVGKECEAIQDELTKAMAGIIVDSEKKPEYDAKVQMVQSSKQHVRK